MPDLRDVVLQSGQDRQELFSESSGMTEEEKRHILDTFIESICAADNAKISPVEEHSHEGQSGIWIHVEGKLAYLGRSYKSALMTARLSDWWIPERDGKMMADDIEWFESRATLGDDWEQQEVRMFREERRFRLAHNIGLASGGELDNDQEK